VTFVVIASPEAAFWNENCHAAAPIQPSNASFLLPDKWQLHRTFTEGEIHKLLDFATQSTRFVP
jgi:hypothetical protein